MKLPRPPGQLGAAGVRRPPSIASALGAPALIAIGLSAFGASIYFGLGVVASFALGLTPFAYLAAGVFFVITVMTYAEANSVHPERGGASTFARYALDEFWSFVAGWAIILDYLIVMALAVFVTAHYLMAFVTEAGSAIGEIVVALLVLAFVVWSNMRGLSADRLVRLLRAGLVSLGLSIAIVVFGIATVWEPGEVLGSVHIGVSPQLSDVVFAAVVAAVAMVGIESASGLAGEIRVGRKSLRRVVVLSLGIVPTVFVLMAIVGLMAQPVVAGSTALGTTWIEAPVLGIVAAFEPTWVREAFSAAVAAVATCVLVLAVNGNMLGLSRLGYSLATNRQIPSLIGRLHRDRATPVVLIAIAALLVFGLTLSSDIEFLAGLVAFGAMLAFTLAHVSVIVLRFREPDAKRAFRIPWSIPMGRGSIPIPAAIGALVGAAAWVSVIVLHEGARVAGGLWMVGGVVLYVVYRLSAGKALRKRFVIPEQSLRDDTDVEYGTILVPVFGGPLDDDIVGTAGRLAAEEAEEGEHVTIEALHVLEIPLSLPIDARVPKERVDAGRRALARAKEVGEEYEGVVVETATVRGRTAGQAIVTEARRRGVELIVLAAEEPTRVRGGALLGGRGGPRERVISSIAQHVVEKAPCRVVVTAPPAGGDGIQDAVAPT